MMAAPREARSLSAADTAWLWELAKGLQQCGDVTAAEALASESRAELQTRGGGPALAAAFDETLGPVLEILRDRERLQSLVIRDPLTGLFNRRQLEAVLPRQVAHAAASGEPLAVGMLDVDAFHDYNERHGHPAGDMVLKAVGVLLEGFARDGDVACRYGGEEFVLIMPGATATDARDRLDALREALAQAVIHHEGHRIDSVTASIGVADLALHGTTAAALLAAADAALYAAKRSGRNRVAVAGAL